MEKNKKIWLPVIITLAVIIVAMLALIITMKISGMTKNSGDTTDNLLESTENMTEADEYASMDLENYSVTGSKAGDSVANTSDEAVTSEDGTEVVGGDALNNTDGYILPDSATVAVTEEDLKDRTPMELTYARNEIYARHGRIFLSEELNKYFQTKTWYTADENFEDTSLSPMETANADFILQYQADNDLSYTAQ